MISIALAATPKFSPDELMQINARVLQQLDFSVVNGRLSDAGLALLMRVLACSERQYHNIDRSCRWWAVCHQPVVPEIEDPDLLAVALKNYLKDHLAKRVGLYGQRQWELLQIKKANLCSCRCERH